MSFVKNKKFFLFLEILMIVILGIAIYSNSLHNPFQFDDTVFVTENFSIRNIHNIQAIWKSVLSHPTRFVGFYTFALNYYFHGLDVFGYHCVNLAIHLLSAIIAMGVIFLLLRVLKSSENEELSIPFIVGLIFVSHPLQTQAVTYISQRFESLASLFYLSAVFLYLWGRLTSHRGVRWGAYAGVCISGIFAMFTKEIAITLPLMILFLEYFFLRHYLTKEEKFLSFKKRKGEIFFFLFLLLFILIIPSMFSFRIKQMLFAPRISSSHQGDILTFSTYLFTQFRVMAVLIRLFFIPYGQNLDYDFPMSHSFFEIKTLMSFFFLLLIIFFAIKSRKKRPLLSLGLLWALIVLSANFIPRRHVIFEHKMYLPLVGLSLFVAVLINDLFKRKGMKFFCVFLIIVGLSLLTFKRNTVWSSGVLLWSDVVKKSPHKARPHSSLGIAYSERGQYADAIREYNKSLQIYPLSDNAYYNRGYAFYQLGRSDLAIQDYTKSIQINPHNPKVYTNRGNIYRERKEFNEAFNDYGKAIELNPQYALAYNNRGNLYSMVGNYDLALLDYNHAIEVDPQYFLAHFNRGLVFLNKGRFKEAVDDFEKTLQLKPSFKTAQIYLERIYCEHGYPEKCLKYKKERKH